MIAVLALQLAGWAYQPPEGDQTSLGYLPDLPAVRSLYSSNKPFNCIFVTMGGGGKIPYVPVLFPWGTCQIGSISAWWGYEKNRHIRDLSTSTHCDEGRVRLR
jgi:hypothetical protein